MAAINKRVGKSGKPSYQVRVRVKGQSRTATFSRLTDAKTWASKTESDLKYGHYVPDTEQLKRTVGDMIDRYLDETLPTKQRNKDQANPIRHLKWWKEQIGGTPLIKATPDLIIEQRTKLLRGKTKRGRARTPATCNRYMVSLSHAFSVACNQWGWLPINPVSKIRKLEETRGRTRFLSDQERKDLLKACKKSASKAIYPIVVLAISTGARRSEILNLKWVDVDLYRQALVIHDTKNNERRRLPIKGHALQVMKDWAKVRRIDTALVFPATNPKNPLEFKKAWANALEAAGINDFRFHDLRHTAASYLAMNGATLAEIAEILGHKTLAMVKRYAHLTEEHTSSVIERMNMEVFGDG